MFQNSELFHNSNEYFDELQNNPNREKPVVEYVLARMNKVEVGYPAYIHVFGHPAAYLDNAHYVITSKVLSYDETTGSFETINTKYVLKKVDK